MNRYNIINVFQSIDSILGNIFAINLTNSTTIPLM